MLSIFNLYPFKVKNNYFFTLLSVEILLYEIDNLCFARETYIYDLL